MKKEQLTFVVVLLALLMWYSNADLFLRLEELNGRSSIGWVILNAILALGYSTLSAISVRHLEDYKYVKYFAIFDGVGVFLHFQSNIPAMILGWIGAVYYALLMYFLVSMIWKLSDIIRKRDKEKMEAKQNACKAVECETPLPQPTSAPTLGEEIQMQLPAEDTCKYPTLKSLNGAISRCKSKTAEELIMLASSEARQEYLAIHPEITIKIS